MMPLTMMKEGEPGVISRVSGKEDTRRFLENLGFVAGRIGCPQNSKRWAL